MLDLLIQCIFIGVTISFIRNSQPYGWILDRFPLNFKPFNCSVCLSFWTVMIWAFIAHDPLLVWGAGIAALAAKLTENEIYNIRLW